MHIALEPAKVTLSQKEQKELEVLVRRHTTPQQLAKRGQMILKAAEGKSNAEIAREMGVSVDTVRSWRRRWIDLQAIPLAELTVGERLTDVPRPGKPSRITREQRCQIVALVLERQEACPQSHWTGVELAQEIMQRGIIRHISPQYAARLLKKEIAECTHTG